MAKIPKHRFSELFEKERNHKVQAWKGVEQSSFLYNSRDRCIKYQITSIVYMFPRPSVSYGPTTFNHSDVMVSTTMCNILQIDVTISKIYSSIINES